MLRESDITLKSEMMSKKQPSNAMISTQERRVSRRKAMTKIHSKLQPMGSDKIVKILGFEHLN